MRKTENIMIRVTEQLKQEVAKAAEDEGKTISEYVMDLVKYDLKKRAE